MDWKDVIKNIAPVIATGFGGPIAGTATKFLAERFLGDPDATEAELSKAILGATPEQLAQLKIIDNDFAVKMAELKIDVYALEVKDRDSARGLAKVNMRPQIILSMIFIGGYFALVFMLFSGEVKITEDIRDMSNILLGVLTASIPAIMQFWFGSSSGSKDKSAYMGNGK